VIFSYIPLSGPHRAHWLQPDQKPEPHWRQPGQDIDSNVLSGLTPD